MIHLTYLRTRVGGNSRLNMFELVETETQCEISFIVYITEAVS